MARISRSCRRSGGCLKAKQGYQQSVRDSRTTKRLRVRWETHGGHHHAYPPPHELSFHQSNPHTKLIDVLGFIPPISSRTIRLNPSHSRLFTSNCLFPFTFFPFFSPSSALSRTISCTSSDGERGIEVSEAEGRREVDWDLVSARSGRGLRDWKDRIGWVSSVLIREVTEDG